MGNPPVPSIKIVLNFKDEVLFLEYGHSWDLPGGRMEPNENIMECLHRELIEELGQDIEFKTEPVLVRVYDYIPKSDGIHRLYVYYSYRLDERADFPSNEAKWLNSKQIQALEIDINWKQMILKAIQ